MQTPQPFRMPVWESDNIFFEIQNIVRDARLQRKPLDGERLKRIASVPEFSNSEETQSD